MPEKTCQNCAYFELIPLDKGGKRRLCHFSGLKNPHYGQAEGCAHLFGVWSMINTLLGLTRPKEIGDTGDPNDTKRGNSFFGLTERIVSKTYTNCGYNLSANADINITGKRFARPGQGDPPEPRIGWERANRFCF